MEVIHIDKLQGPQDTRSARRLGMSVRFLGRTYLGQLPAAMGGSIA